MRFQLYCGLTRGGKWFNYTEVEPLQGGVLAMLEGAEMTGAARLLNLIKGSIKKLYTEDGEEYEMKPSDYEDIKVHDSWKIGYEQIKLRTKSEYPIISENFYCGRCSQPKREQYTTVEESWAKLIEDGILDEIFLLNSDDTFEVELPDPIVIPAGKTFSGGTFSTIRMRHLTIGDMLKIHRNADAMSTQANLIRATWDASLVGVDGLAERDFNRLINNPNKSFSGSFLNSDENLEAVEAAMEENVIGIDASRRVIYCKNCGNMIREGMDYTNFFLPLLPKKSNRRHL